VAATPMAVAWLTTVAVALVGIRLGPRVLRGRRHLVLFLRRFRNRTAVDAVTLAVARYIGRSRRVITLDDSVVAPIGLTPGTKRMFDLGSAGKRGLEAGRGRFQLGMSVAFASFLGIFGIAYLYGLMNAPDSDDALEVGLAHLGAISMASFSAGHLTHPLGLDLETAYAFLLLMASVTAIVLALVAGVFGLLRILFLYPLTYLATSYETTVDSIADERRQIRSKQDVEPVVAEIRKESRRLTFPRLTVVKVNSEVWQASVARIAELCSVILIDISEPTESLLWEVQALKRRKKRFVIVGDNRLVSDLVSASPSTVLLQRLADLIRDEQVLIYSPDEVGRKRFGTALRGLL
jgi:hypothetical protein